MLNKFLKQFECMLLAVVARFTEAKPSLLGLPCKRKPLGLIAILVMSTRGTINPPSDG
jgi:hypothetical protein